MAKKNGAKGSSNDSGVITPINTSITTSDKRAEATLGTLATDPIPEVKVNKANLVEIKGALDDIVKKVLHHGLLIYNKLTS